MPMSKSAPGRDAIHSTRETRGRPLFVSYVLVTRNEASARCIVLTVANSPVFKLGFGCNAHREKVFRFVALAREITGEAAFTKAPPRYCCVSNLLSRLDY